MDADRVTVHSPRRAPALRRGDYIGVVSPSSGLAASCPDRVRRGVAALESLGFGVKIGRHALGECGWVSGAAEHRAQDLHEMFLDPEVRLILATIGGDHCCQLLPLLDFELIAAHPTLLMGFSDVTVLNVAIWQRTGLVTCNGPALLSDFAEFPEVFEYTKRACLDVLCDARPPGPLPSSPWWTEEFLDWQTGEDLTRPRQRQPSEGWTWLQGEGVAEGILVGGCLESLQHLRGTSFWPSFEEAVFFWETSEEVPPPEEVDALLSDYENMGVLGCLRGMLVGRPIGYSAAEKEELRDVIRGHTAAYGFPVVCDMDFGHTAPQLTLPLGCRARIDAAGRRVEILEGAVRSDRAAADGALVGGLVP